MYIQIVSSYAPSYGFGGTVPLFYDYARWMMSKSNVLVMTANIHHNYKAFPRDQEITDINIKRYSVYFKFLVRKSITLISFSMLIDLLKLIHTCKDKQIILHLCETRGIVNIYALIAKLIYGDKILIFHSVFGMMQKSNSLKRRVYDKLITKKFLESVSLTLVQNENEAGIAKSFFKFFNINQQKLENHNIHLMPVHLFDRPSDIDLLSHQELSIDLSKTWDLSSKSIVVGFLGRFHKNKGLENLYKYTKAYQAEMTEDLNIDLVFVGRDEGFLDDLKQYQKEAEGIHNFRVKIIENIYGEDRFKVYSLFDCYVGLPLVSEETMVASIESLSMGTPVILNQNAQIPFSDISEGAVSYVSDFEEFKQALNNILLNRDELRRNAKNFAMTHFSVSSAKKNFLEFF